MAVNRMRRVPLSNDVDHIPNSSRPSFAGLPSVDLCCSQPEKSDDRRYAGGHTSPQELLEMHCSREVDYPE